MLYEVAVRGQNDSSDGENYSTRGHLIRETEKLMHKKSAYRHFAKFLR